MGRFRRKQKVVWLPTDLSVALDANNEGGSNIGTFFIDQAGALAIGSSANDDIPLVLDNPLSPGATTSLSDIENSGYRLRRIVGKIWVSVDQVVQDDAGSAIVTAGFIVRRVDPNGVAALASARRNPSFAENIADPWIWRRSWLLANAASTNAEDTWLITMPTANTQYGSVADGPHVDAKTARVIGREERLFLSVSSTLGNANTTGTFRTRWGFDLRVLGSMRTTTGNRGNATR